MRSFILAAYAAAFVLLFSSAALADTTGLVRGTITAAGKPAAGVIVELHGDGTGQTTTDASGNFSFPHMPFGHYTLIARRGTQSATTTLDVSTDAVVTVALDIAPLREIGHTGTTASAGAAGTPVSVNTIGRRRIAALPSNNSLNSLIQTVPGIVPFSYNEPVAHGFHGLTYEIDGAPLPQTTSSNFAEIVDPHNVDSLEIFTGAIPAEFGGNRSGAVVNVVTDRANDLATPSEGTASIAAGSYGTKQANLSESLALGQSRLFLNGNLTRSDRGLDSPTFVPNHDDNNEGDEFARFIAPLGKRSTLAFDLSNQQSTFQIPINTDPNNFYDPNVSVPGTDDVQREYDRFANVVFTQNTPDGRGFVQIIPWARYSRVAYDGDFANDLAGTGVSLTEDRHTDDGGLRLSYFHSSEHHALKFGAEGNYQNFTGATAISQIVNQTPPNPSPILQVLNDNVAKRGTQLGAYIQDKWTPSRAVTIDAGLRYDRSNGFTSGNQLSPRIGVNVAADPKNILHVYYGRFYAAPFLEDTRCDALFAGMPQPGAAPTTTQTLTCGQVASTSGGLGTYDLQPEHDSYFEMGVAHTFAPRVTGYFNYWTRNVANVLDTTQLASTPIFAVFNNTVGRAEGAEVHFQDDLLDGDSYFLSATVSTSAACGISGATFLFTGDLTCDTGLQPEDHDQTYSINTAYTHRFGAKQIDFATLQPVYGSGYPVNFQNGQGRLPTHLTFNASVGRDVGRGAHKSVGYSLDLINLTGRTYLLKVNNGFNTTQWAQGFNALVRLTVPF
jgi:outer membrane receptor protein involved in Fe transport